MSRRLVPPAFATLALCLTTLASSSLAQEKKEKDDGFVSLFDGKTLEGWDGNPKFWTVEDEAITGRTTADNPTDGNTFLVWKDDVADFELTLQYKIVGGNSGIQYRSFRLKDGADKWRLGGYQADIDSKETYSGIVYGEKARGVLVGRGESGKIAADGKKTAERFTDSAELQSKIRQEDWNEYRIVAEGNHLTHYINGFKTAELVDEDEAAEGKRMAKGLLGLQLHAGPPMTIQFRAIKLKKLEPKKQAARLRLRVDEQGRVALDGELIDDAKLVTTLGKLNVEVLREGIAIEADASVPMARVQWLIGKCQDAGIERISLRASKERISIDAERVQIDVRHDGAVTARAGDVGFGFANGRGRITVYGVTAFEFGDEPAAPAVPAEPEVDLGAPAEIELGDEATLEVAEAPSREIAAPQSAAAAVEAKQASPRKIVFIAGPKSHGYGAHEHKAGCLLLAAHLEQSGLPVETKVVTDGWPKDASVLDDADCIVVYADGGDRHPFNAHIDELRKLTDKGVGIVAIHYGVEVPKGKSGDAFLDWTGGYFEADWSVNPHWTADYKALPKHPITRGVGPFSINDEWYYHMRFREEMAGVTPILTDLPPAGTLVKEDGTLARPDNAHNNNPYVRKAVLEQKQPQHMAWATERKDGGRGFGLTGGHFHWNWGNDEMRKLMLNAIAWSAKVDVPEQGVPTQSVSVQQLMENQDEEAPGNFNPARIKEMLKQWNGARAE